MDAETAQYYETHAQDLAARYDAVASPLAQFFSVAFPEGARVLDVGAGSGRDLAALLRAGYDGFGIEPCENLRMCAEQAHPELIGRLKAGLLPTSDAPFGGAFGGVLCCAVLMHLPEAELFDAALSLRRLLKPHGRILLSLPSSRLDVGDDERDAGGRLFKTYTAEYLQLLFERLGFQAIGRWELDDALKRAGTRWYGLLLELRSSGPLRAVDQIEGILNRDRKVATYKFALFRALAEIATQEPRAATWFLDGNVGVPIERIAERWLKYFWPIFASGRIVPQSQAEGAGPNQPVAFRAPMGALMAEFAGQGEHGGFAAWHAAWTAGQLPPQVTILQAQALRSIANTVRSGPVAFAGGALETGAVFSYERSSRSVVMSADLWRELTLLGHWILDAVIVRWAALTGRFARRQGLSSGDVLPLLLAQPDPMRTTALARKVYLAEGVNRCAWTDRPLDSRRLAVDHVIPFALWGNNDLWNLLPVDATVNGSKSDKLPAAALLAERQSEIVRHWRCLRDAVPEAFDRQAGHLLGRRPSGPQAWESDLFGCLRQSIEVTALQRGVERWDPNPGVPSDS